jgi:hypothetical protein
MGDRYLLEVRFVESFDKREMAIVVVVVQSVTNDECVRDFETEKVRFHFDFRSAFFHEKCNSSNAGWLAALKCRDQFLHRVSSVENVIENQDIAVSNIRQQSQLDSQFSRLGCRASITGRLNDSDTMRHVDGSDKICHKQHATGESTDHRQILPPVKVRNFGAKRMNTLLDFMLFDQTPHAVFSLNTGRKPEAGKNTRILVADHLPLQVGTASTRFDRFANLRRSIVAGLLRRTFIQLLSTHDANR